ncbi:MAG: hypothetical protein RL318_949 [Fibrobacterota bacterium]|jgi:mannose-6-phosphate isomerase
MKAHVFFGEWLELYLCQPMKMIDSPLSMTSVLRCLPHLVERPWGGERLQGWGRECRGRKIGESWELCGLEGSSTAFSEGAWPTLRDMACDPSDPLELHGDAFPLLLKLIDADEPLSIQLHPCCETVDGLPKTEAWIVLEAPEGAFLYAGIRQELPARELIERVASGDLSVLEQVTVKAGDVVFIPGGTLHAITAGLVIAEIQQSSDTTWRVWDWGRRDAQGNGRTLHIPQAIRDVDPTPRSGLLTKPLADHDGCEYLVACPSFAARRHVGSVQIVAATGWRILLQVGDHGLMTQADGKAEVFARGQTLLLPKGAEVNVEGGSVLEFWVPDLEADVRMPLLAAGHDDLAIRALGAGTW